jgi:hypothetical protein
VPSRRCRRWLAGPVVLGLAVLAAAEHDHVSADRTRGSAAGKAHRPAQIVPKQLKLEARCSDIMPKPTPI